MIYIYIASIYYELYAIIQEWPQDISQVNAPSHVELSISLMDFKCQPCWIFENISHQEKHEAVAPANFVDSVQVYSPKKGEAQ